MKKHRLFLYIGMAVFAVSLAMFFAVIIGSAYSEYKAIVPTLSPRDLIDYEFDLAIRIFACVLFGTPALLLELSFVRSVYRILKHRPVGAARICRLISAAMAFIAFVLLMLMFTGTLNFSEGTGSLKQQETALLLTGWPVVIISFILGSIRGKNVKGDNSCIF